MRHQVAHAAATGGQVARAAAPRTGGLQGGPGGRSGFGGSRGRRTCTWVLSTWMAVGPAAAVLGAEARNTAAGWGHGEVREGGVLREEGLHAACMVLWRGPWDAGDE